MDLKQAAISISMIVFVLSSMLGMGLGLRVSEIVAPLRALRFELDAIEEQHAQTAVELDAILPALLDSGFKEKL